MFLNTIVYIFFSFAMVVLKIVQGKLFLLKKHKEIWTKTTKRHCTKKLIIVKLVCIMMLEEL